MAELAVVASVLLRGAAPDVALDFTSAGALRVGALPALPGRLAGETAAAKASALVVVGADAREDLVVSGLRVVPGSEPGLDEGRAGLLAVGTVRTVAMMIGLPLVPPGSEGACAGGVPSVASAEAVRDDATTGAPLAGVAVRVAGVPRGGVDVGRVAASAVTACPLAEVGRGGAVTRVPVAGVLAAPVPLVDDDDAPEMTPCPDADIALGRSTDAGVVAVRLATGRASSCDDDVGAALVGGGGSPCGAGVDTLDCMPGCAGGSVAPGEPGDGASASTGWSWPAAVSPLNNFEKIPIFSQRADSNDPTVASDQKPR